MPSVKIKSEYSDLDKYKLDGGNICYCKKNKNIWHNPYGAAYIGTDGYKEYWIENKLHRLDGPAIMYLNDREYYYINGNLLTKEEFEVHPDRLKFIGKEYLICLG